MNSLPSFLPDAGDDSPFRFEMGLRRQSDKIFQQSPTAAEQLAERRRWLTECPERHAALLPGAESIMNEAAEFAAPFLDQPPPPLTGLPLCRWLGSHWEPDFILLAQDGGHFRLVGGAVCFPSSWSLSEKLGLGVTAIHDAAPRLNPQLESQIDSFLSRLKPGALWQRWNLGLAATAERNQHPERRLPRLSPSADLTTTWLRAEEQAFVSLPNTLGLLFVIRMHVSPVTEIHPNDAFRLARWLESMPEDVAVYKGLAAARKRLAAQLREQAS